jgi:hypothetical protein
VEISVLPTGAYAQQLKSHRRGYTTVAVSFTGAGGDTASITRKLRLVRR